MTTEKRDLFFNHQIQKIAEYTTPEPDRDGDKLLGGVADGKKPEDIAEDKKEKPKEIDKQVMEGTAVEMEHTDDPDTAQEIAEDHVEEYPKGEDYYEDLKKMEDEAETKVEKDLGDPDESDKDIILKFLRTQDDLDDETMHKLYVTLGVDPHEGEEVVYSALQEYLQKNPGLIDPSELEEQEIEEWEDEDEMAEKEASDLKNKLTFMDGYMSGYMREEIEI